ncbi:hypothetical protein [Streptomyces sp. NPDC088785]|uniref:hypothetical protein n=1 Tax=Streptomyces sp. NPDC088785 TaxID=3365897 RepID=UPI003804ED8B
MRVSGAAAVGCGALFGLLPVLALIGRFGFPDDPPGFIPVFGGPLLAASLGIAVFLVVLGYSLTFQQLALADMYARAEDPSSLRNAVEARGRVSRTPFFPAVVTSVVIGCLLLATAGILLAASAWPPVAIMLLVAGGLCVPAVLALLAADRRWRRTAGERLPAQAVGEQGRAQLLLNDTDTKRRQQLKARDRAEATGLNRASTPVLLTLAVAVLAVMSPSLSPTAHVWRRGQQVGAGIGVLCLIVFLCIGALRVRRLRRALARVRRGGPAVTDVDRAHAITATTAQAAEVHAATAIWALLGAGTLGTLIPRSADVAPVLIATVLWTLGIILLLALSMRADAAAPKLREEHGYRLPTTISGNDNTWH